MSASLTYVDHRCWRTVEIFLADQRVFTAVEFGDNSGEKIMTTRGESEETTRRVDAHLPRAERRG
jgi:hypothetical protein